ncbi:MAG: hypothetical protein QM500_16090 [Methylococcales bacterium]
MNITPHNKVVSLDDGNATILLAKERRGHMLSDERIGIKKKSKLFLKKVFQNIKNIEYDKLEFFTIYDITPGDNDSVIRNEFKHLRSGLTSMSISEVVYFIGSPVSESGIMNQYDYLKHLKRVKVYYKDKKMLYVSHRRENKTNLSEISRELGIEVVTFDYPIEYQLSIMKVRPLVMASFVSSALDSCSLIFGDTMNIAAFRLNLDGSPLEDEIDGIYEAYMSNESPSFNVIVDY